jgi:peptide/nickel transport system permease protein
MTGYILKRLVSAIPVLLGISIIVFLIMAMIPGDPATAILGSFATPENVAALNEDLGLDKPLVQQYFIWLGNMLQGDFGPLLRAQPPGPRRGAGAFQRHARPGRHGFVLCTVLGIAAGVISAANQYGLADKAITFVVLLGISIPSFFLGMMMILIFAVNLRWFPVSGMWPIYGDRTLWVLLDHLAMPATALRSWPRA